MRLAASAAALDSLRGTQSSEAVAAHPAKRLLSEALGPPRAVCSGCSGVHGMRCADSARRHDSEGAAFALALGSGWRKLGLCQRDRMGSLAAAVASATHTVAIATTTLAVSAAALALS